jgi:hypothetical protein
MKPKGVHHGPDATFADECHDNVNSFCRGNFANDLTANAGFAIGVG